MKALIIVDIQHDFLPGGALEVAHGDQVIPVVNQLQDQFPLVVATQDWHPEKHGSFASAHPGKQVFDTIDLQGLDQILWPDHCIQGSEGASFPKELNHERIEAIFRKGLDPMIDSYSGFFDNGRKKSTGLTGYLRAKGVDEVFICGLAGDFCVAYTTLDAISEGFKTWLIKDATRPIDKDGFDSMISNIVEKGGYVVTSDSL